MSLNVSANILIVCVTLDLSLGTEAHVEMAFGFSILFDLIFDTKYLSLEASLCKAQIRYYSDNIVLTRQLPPLLYYTDTIKNSIGKSRLAK